MPSHTDQGSRYCGNHKPQICSLQAGCEDDEELNSLDAPLGPLIRSKKGEMIAEMILAVHTTRKRTYYKVTPALCMQDCTYLHHMLYNL